MERGRHSAILTLSDLVPDLQAEAGGGVGGVPVAPLLVSLVLLLVFQVVALNDDGVLHFDRRDDAVDDLSPDREAAVERAVGVVALRLGGGDVGEATSIPMSLISAVISSPNLLDSVLWSVHYL